jgi:dihydrolipoamide dehydrogenase
MKKYDVIILGSGPGGYVAAIRAAQLGFKTAIIEKENLGGICLNWGCIPTKALLKSASVFETLNHASDYGIFAENLRADFSAIIKRSRDVAAGMSKGVQFLMQKNKIEVILGFGKILPGKKVLVKKQDNTEETLEGTHIVLATGARSRELPNLKQDGEKIIGYRKAMSLAKQPKSMVIVGSGAIGMEFAYFYSSLGTKVTVVEYLPNILPLEDEEVSKAVEKIYKKKGIEILTQTEVMGVNTTGKDCVVQLKTAKGEEKIEAEIVLSAVGIQPNLENIGLEEVGIALDKGRIKVDAYYQTNIAGYYAIGDIIATPALAHVASSEAIACIEKIKGLHVEPIDYTNIPACTYCVPEVASVGYSEKTAQEKGYKIKVGKFPFSASGKASAMGNKDGFVKLIFEEKTGEILGAHMLGANVTEMIAEIVALRKLEATGHEIIKTMHPHPTLSEAVMEAAAAAYGEVIHL